MNVNFRLTTVMSALAAAFFLSTHMSEARADETSALFNQRC